MKEPKEPKQPKEKKKVDKKEVAQKRKRQKELDAVVDEVLNEEADMLRMSDYVDRKGDDVKKT